MGPQSKVRLQHWESSEWQSMWVPEKERSSGLQPPLYGAWVLWYHRALVSHRPLRPGCHHVTMSQCHRALGHEVEGTCWGRKREKEGVLVFPCRMLCQNVYQVIQVQANEVLTKRIRSIKCNLMRQDGGVSGGVQKMNLSFVSRLTCIWDQIRWKQCQTMVESCLRSQEAIVSQFSQNQIVLKQLFSLTQKPKVASFSRTKKATIYFTAILIRTWVHLPDPPIRCIWRPNYPLSIIK